MNGLLIQGIPLSSTTKNAWHAAGVTPVTPQAISTLSPETKFVIRYGYRGPLPQLLTQQTSLFQWNSPTQLGLVSKRDRFQEVFSQFVPPSPWEVDQPTQLWIKGPGRAGQNKILLTLLGQLNDLPSGYTIQEHIDGEEFRLNTVGNRIVQCHLRRGENSNRSYEWLRMRSVPSVIKETVRAAALHLSELTDPKHTLAWDVVANEEEAYILEANGAPGVNEETAKRIVKEITRQMEEANA